MGEQLPSVLLVTGASGGSGTSTVALGIADACSTVGLEVAAVDGALGGGDLGELGCAAARPSAGVGRGGGVATLDTVLEPRAMAGLPFTAAGSRILGRSSGDAAEPDFRRLDWRLRSAFDLCVYDLGHRAIGRSATQPLVLESETIVVTVAARRDALARVRDAVHTLRFVLGEYRARHAVIALVRQNPSRPEIFGGQLRDRLGDQVAGVVEIPYDEGLATGHPITEASPHTVEAFDLLRRAVTVVGWTSVAENDGNW